MKQASWVRPTKQANPSTYFLILGGTRYKKKYSSYKFRIIIQHTFIKWPNI